MGERMGLKPDLHSARSAAKFMMEARAWVAASSAS